MQQKVSHKFQQLKLHCLSIFRVELENYFRDDFESSSLSETVDKSSVSLRSFSDFSDDSRFSGRKVLESWNGLGFDCDSSREAKNME